MESKSIFLSTTFWANVLSFAATAGAMYGLDVKLSPEEQTTIVAGIISIVNIALRFKTSQPVHLVK